MIAHCAEHPVLQISKGQVVGKTASVDLSVMVTVRVAANDKHTVSAVTSHVAQTRGLVVEYEVRDCPGHRLTKRVRGGSAINVHRGDLKAKADEHRSLTDAHFHGSFVRAL